MFTSSIEVGGKQFTFEIAEGTTPPVLFMGIRKSGSSIFFKLCNAVCKRAGIPVVDVPQTFFSRNVPANEWRKLDAAASLLRAGNSYIGFRAPPMAFANSPAYPGARKVLLVRDPRDALCSQYFSTAFSHSLPKAGADPAGQAGGVREKLLEDRKNARQIPVTQYVRDNAAAMARTYVEYAQLLQGQQYTLLKYEDVIFNKRELLNTIAAHLSVEITEKFIEGVLGWADVKPDSERPREFIRRVTPGDYRDKLDAPTIEFINGKLAAAVKPFGYELS